MRFSIPSFLLAVCAVVAIGGSPAAARSHAAPTPSPSPSPPPVADPAVTKIARQQFVAWQAGTLDHRLYVPELVAKLTPDKVDDVSRRLGGLGFLVDTAYIGPFVAPDLPTGSHGYIYQMICSAGKVYLWLVLDDQNKVATIFFRDKFTTETVEVPGSPEPSPTP